MCAVKVLKWHSLFLDREGRKVHIDLIDISKPVYNHIEYTCRSFCKTALKPVTKPINQPRGGGGGGGGYSPNMVNGGVPLKWVTFFPKKIPKHAPHFCNFTVDTRYFRPFKYTKTSFS